MLRLWPLARGFKANQALASFGKYYQQWACKQELQLWLVILPIENENICEKDKVLSHLWNSPQT